MFSAAVTPASGSKFLEKLLTTSVTLQFSRLFSSGFWQRHWMLALVILYSLADHLPALERMKHKKPPNPSALLLLPKQNTELVTVINNLRD